MRIRASKIVVGGLLLLVCGAASLRAQQFQGGFTGVVTDTSGAVIPDAQVTAVEMATGFIRSATTLRDGSFEIPLLPPGEYQLTAKKAGFETTVRGPLNLQVNAHIKIDFQMKVGAQTTTITVEAAPPLLDTQTSSVGTTIGQQEAHDLPLNGRQFLELTLFTPGVVPGTTNSENSTRGGAINVNGTRESMNSYWLDGVNNTSVAVGQYAISPPIDSVQEFRMETGLYEAKFGTNAGAQVNVVTKSGTNKLHGSLYNYFRNSNLDARNFFDPTVPPFRRNQFGGSVGGPVTVPSVYNGHDRTFFFFAYEGLRERRDFFEQNRVPTLAERTGNFAGDLGPDCQTKNLLLDPLILADPNAPLTVPNNDLSSLLPFFPTGTTDAIGQSFVNLYPKPNIQNAACGAANYVAEGNRTIDTDSFVTRMDHRWGTRDSIFGRYNISNDREFRPFNDTNLSGYGLHVHDVNTNAGLDWTHALGPNLLNEAKLGYNRWDETLDNQDEGNPFAQNLGIVGLNTQTKLTGVPALNFSGYENLGSATNNPQGGAVNTFEVADTLTWVHGNHTFAFGFDIRPIHRGNFTRNITIRGQYDFTGVTTGGVVLAGLQQALPAAQFQVVEQQLLQACPPPGCEFGNSIADALIGFPQDWINGFQANVAGAATEWDFFGQDDWKVARNLTLNLGLRYEYNSLVTDKYNRFSNFDFQKGLLVEAGRKSATLISFDPATQSYVPAGTESFGSTAQNEALQYPDKDNLAPRIGFSWQPFGRKDTVLRGGYGIFYDQTFGDVYFQRASNPPFVRVSAGNIGAALPSLLPAIESGTLPLGSGAFIQNAFALAAAPLYPVISPFQLDFQDSFIQEWSLDIQRELPGSWLLDTEYMGTRGLRLPRSADPNQKIITQGTSYVRPYPAFDQNFIYTESSGSSIYHALQVKAVRRFATGLSFIAAYTYSKSIDTNSTFFSTNRNTNFPQNSYDLAAEKAPSDFDYRHRFSFAYVYELPFGKTLLLTDSKAANNVLKDWEASGIMTVESGAPFTPQISGDVSCTEEGSDRPNLVGNPYPAHPTPNQWILPSAFRDPRVDAAGNVIAPCAFGNAGRNILRGPGLADWDFSLIREFNLGESKRLEFRAEMFNIFNHANFETPDANVASPTFGKIFNTVQSIAGLASGGPGDPREVQLVLRLKF